MRWLPLLALCLLATRADAAPCAAVAGACKCAFNAPADELARSQAVFSGFVVRNEARRFTQVWSDSAGALVATNLPGLAITLRVTRGWKGVSAGDTLTLVDMHLCGASYGEGEEYLVYARDEGTGDLSTSFCQRTRLIAPPEGGRMSIFPTEAEEMALLDSLVQLRRP
jgi:hypothetical protein